jgi:predicted nuclease of predicted toxin-antitoxin system
MRILIDECIDPRVKLLFKGDQAATVHDRGWDAIEDGPLLARAQKEFDVLLTIDGKMEFQQNIPKYSIGLVVVHVPKNQLTYYRAIIDELCAAIEGVRPGQVIHVRTPQLWAEA